MIEGSFLRTKLYIPPYRTGSVSRPELVARLEARPPRKLVLLSAPAGFGKTTLLCEWIQATRQAHRPAPTIGQAHSPAPTIVAWLTLDEGDNDVRRFLGYLARALDVAEVGGSAQPLSDMRSAQTPAVQSILDRLINAIDERLGQSPPGSRAILILDDYHVITAEAVHQCLVYLLEHLPPQMQVVAAGRADPPLPLARMRGRGDVLELRANELRFSKAEAGQFLNRVMELDLPEPEIAALENRTEGWVAGLQMAALALHGLAGSQAAAGAKVHSPTVSAFIQQLGGSNRYIMDYLVEEVLQRQPETIQEFLLKTSILERMCEPLCVALTGASAQHDGLAAAPSMLEVLERANLFVVPLDDRREWYRYHRLFVDLLRKRLSMVHPDQVSGLHQRASAWFEAHGALEEAVEHAFAAGDISKAARLVGQAAEGLMMRGQFLTLKRWLDALPGDQVGLHPMLCVFHAWTLFLSNAPLSRVETCLAMIRSDDEGRAAMAAPLRAYIAAFRGLMMDALRYARQALQGLPEKETFLRSMAYIILAASELSEGDPEAGYRAFDQATRLGNQTGNILASAMALNSLAENDRKEGHLHQAERRYRQALEQAVDFSGNYLPIAGRIMYGLGDLLRELNRLDEADHYLSQGIELTESWGALSVYSCYLALARLRQSQRDYPAAAELVQKARRLAAGTQSTSIDDRITELFQAGLDIVLGNLAPAETWAEESRLLQEIDPARLEKGELFIYTHLRKYELVVLSRLRLAQGRTSDALELLNALLPEVDRLPRLGLRIEIRILQALALDDAGMSSQALEALQAALSLAEPAGYLRLFLDEGEPVARLLMEILHQEPSSTYVARLLAAIESDQSPAPERQAPTGLPQPVLPPGEALSERELQVLALLKSRLTVPEMAQELCIAESTLRSHVKSIYAKLGAHRRVDAVQRAEALGLIA